MIKINISDEVRLESINTQSQTNRISRITPSRYSLLR